jgi:hypothetical protein
LAAGACGVLMESKFHLYESALINFGGTLGFTLRAKSPRCDRYIFRCVDGSDTFEFSTVSQSVS